MYLIKGVSERFVNSSFLYVNEIENINGFISENDR